MLDKRTVFILGAGASCPYGYPSGAQLRKLICLDDNTPYPLVSVHKDMMSKKIREFRNKFFKSNTSIDLFMARNPKFSEIGKWIIAFRIFEAEGRSEFIERAERAKANYQDHPSFTLKGLFIGGDWYSYLFRLLTAKLAKPNKLPIFPNEQIVFITFNYDRSLEYFLYTSLRNSFTEVPEDNIVHCLQKLKIIHIYGQIAPLPWQDSKQGVKYKPSIEAILLNQVAPNIKTIYEQEESPEINQAIEHIEQAEQIFFLGFGYAPENMQILNLPDSIASLICKIFGTTHGKNDKEIKDIYSDFQSSARIEPIFENMDCLELLRNYL